MRRRFITLAPVAAIVVAAAAPAPASASCTEQYFSCITAAAAIQDPVKREMLNIECFTEWTGCLLKALVTW